MLKDDYHLLLDGGWVPGADGDIPILDKYRLEPFATITGASEAQIGQMAAAADAAFRRGAPAGHERGRILDRAAALLDDRTEDFVAALGLPAGVAAREDGGHHAGLHEHRDRGDECPARFRKF